MTPFAPEIASCSLGRSQSRRKKKSRDIKKCVFDLYKCTRNQGRHAARTPSAIYYQTWWSPPSPPCCRLPVGGCSQADASPSDASYCELRGRCYLMRTLIGFQVMRSNCTSVHGCVVVLATSMESVAKTGTTSAHMDIRVLPMPAI